MLWKQVLFKVAGGGGFRTSLPKTDKKRQHLSSTKPFPTSCGFVVFFYFVLCYVLVDLCSVERSFLTRAAASPLAAFSVVVVGAELPPGLRAVPSWRALCGGGGAPGGPGRGRAGAEGSLARRDCYFEARRRLERQGAGRNPAGIRPGPAAPALPRHRRA